MEQFFSSATRNFDWYYHQPLKSRPARNPGRKPAPLRLIYVKPNLKDGLIECTMHHLDERSRYTAVSYAWGNPNDRTHILINGRLFEVRRNLWQFLNHVRGVKPSRMYWIDALSINQKDVTEKSHQVQMMGRIYRQADEVLAWLSSGNDQISHFMMKVKGYGAMSVTQMLAESAEDGAFWDGFRQIKDSVYWTRAWTAQEFLLPRNGRLAAGNHSVSKDDVASFLRHLQVCRETGQQKLLTIKQALCTQLSPAFKTMWNLGPSSGYEGDKWWQLAKDRYCFDIRDRVYSILSLKYAYDIRKHYSINPFEVFYGLRVDYTITPVELLLECLWLGRRLEFGENQETGIDIKTAREIANMLEINAANFFMVAQKERRLPRVKVPQDARTANL